MIALFDTFVDVGEVSAEAGDWFKDGGSGSLSSLALLVGSCGLEVGVLPVWPVKSLDGLCVEVLYGLLVASADSVLGAGIAVESVDGFCNAHLRGGHGCNRCLAVILDQ